MADLTALVYSSESINHCLFVWSHLVSAVEHITVVISGLVVL